MEGPAMNPQQLVPVDPETGEPIKTPLVPVDPETGEPIKTAPPSGLPSPELSSYVPDEAKKAWELANKPLWEAPARWGREFENYVANEGPFSGTSNETLGMLNGLVAGLGRGVGEVASGFTSPLNAAFLMSGMGEGAALRQGLPKVAQGLGYVTKALGAPMVAHGAYTGLAPESALEERLMAIPEVAGGAAGMLHTPVSPAAYERARIQALFSNGILPETRANLGRQVGEHTIRTGGPRGLLPETGGETGLGRPRFIAGEAGIADVFPEQSPDLTTISEARTRVAPRIPGEINPTLAAQYGMKPGESAQLNQRLELMPDGTLRDAETGIRFTRDGQIIPEPVKVNKKAFREAQKAAKADITAPQTGSKYSSDPLTNLTETGQPKLVEKPGYSSYTPEVQALIDKLAEEVKNLPPRETPPPEDVQFMQVPGSTNIAMGGASPKVLQTLGSSLYGGDRPTIIAKELIQNAVDEHRITGSTEPVRILYNSGDSHPTLGYDTPSITVRDFGRGLSASELYTIFTDLGESGKGGIESASGGFGFAKAAPMLGGEYVEVKSVVLENGQKVEYSFKGNPSELKNQTVGVPLKNRIVPPETKTGMTVKTYFEPGTSTTSSYNFIKKLREYSENLDSEIQIGDNIGRPTYDAQETWLNEGTTADWRNPDKVFTTSSATKPVLTKIGNFSTRGADIEISHGTLEPEVQTNYRLHIQNKGLYQATDYGEYSGLGVENAPSEIIANIKATVEEGHPDYPFTVNREQLNYEVKDAIKKWVNENVVGAQIKKRKVQIQRAYDEMDNLPRAGNVYFVDQGKRFTPEEIEQIQNNYTVRNASLAIKEAHKLLTEAADKMGWSVKPSKKVKKFGLFFGDLGKGGEKGKIVLGVHIPNPSDADSSAILINLAEHIKAAAQTSAPVDKLASSLFATMTHEISHTVPSFVAHGEDFAYRHADLLSKIGAKKTIDLLKMLGDPFGGIKNGRPQFSPEVLDFLQIYEASRKRPASTDDPLLGTGTAITRPSVRPANQTGNVRGATGGTVNARGRGRPRGQPRYERPSTIREIYELARGTTASFDLSAPLRQGLGLAGTKRWFQAWGPMVKSFGSETAFEVSQARIANLPNVRNGLARESGLFLNELGNNLSRREEFLQSTWAEKIPGIRASNRAFTTFLNELRAQTFNDLVIQAREMGIDIGHNPIYARALAAFVNDATGRGRYKFGVNLEQPPSILSGLKTSKGEFLNLEKASYLLNSMFFSGRLMASRVRMLNPGTWIFLPPQIRNQYFKSLIRMAGIWMTMAQLGKMAGAEVSTDPTSSDFGKMKFGNTRIDAAGGFQQYLVLLSRLVTGQVTSSVTDKTTELGKGFKAKTRMGLLYDFGVSKLHPTAKWAWDLLNASEYKPFNFGDRTAQLYIPMILGDLAQIAREDPSLLPVGLMTGVGWGTQTYEKGQPERVFIPEEYDTEPFTGGALPF